MIYINSNDAVIFQSCRSDEGDAFLKYFVRKLLVILLFSDHVMKTVNYII